MEGTIMPIVLKNHAGDDVTFTFQGRTANGVIFDSRGDSLQGKKRLTLQLVEGREVNRVRYKISAPAVCDDANNCGKTVVAYTLVASGDMSVVRAASSDDIADLVALTASLASSDAIDAMANEGILPE